MTMKKKDARDRLKVNSIRHGYGVGEGEEIEVHNRRLVLGVYSEVLIHIVPQMRFI